LGTDLARGNGGEKKRNTKEGGGRRGTIKEFEECAVENKLRLLSYG